VVPKYDGLLGRTVKVVGLSEAQRQSTFVTESYEDEGFAKATEQPVLARAVATPAGALG
jgi:hypothetical protein